MIKTINCIHEHIKTKVIAVFLLLWTSTSWAALPTVEDPSRGQGKGIFETAKNYAFDASVFVGLAIAAVGFLGVAWHCIQVFSEVQQGKKKWADFGGVFAVGVILLVVVIWLLTKAAEIL